MIAYKSLQEVLDRTVIWEKKLNDLYDVAQIGIKNEESKKLMSFLKERQDANLEVLEGLDVKQYGPGEWLKFSGDYRDDELIPSKEFHRDSTPDEILSHILKYEEKLMGFYAAVADHVASEAQHDLFDSLKRFKEEQTNRIKNFVRVS